MGARYFLVSCLALLCLGGIAQAAITIDTVTVGDPGNAGELSGAGAGGDGPNRICGSVGYNYNIGKYEVTAGQYTAFLNAVARTDTYALYNTTMSNTSYGSGITRSGASGTYTYSVASDFVNRPVNYVNFWDACRFANWLHNGQPIGVQTAATTERGAYTLDGCTGRYGGDIQRNAGWKWAVTSEDEWYKAAYYKGGGTSAGYWDYPTSNDTEPGQDMADASGNNANCRGTTYPIAPGKYTTVAGEFQNSDSPYGTFDQGGNVWEWNESIVFQGTDGAYRGLRGGSFYYQAHTAQASYRTYHFSQPALEIYDIGFRISQFVPEPSSIIVLGSGILALAGMIRRRNG